MVLTVICSLLSLAYVLLILLYRRGWRLQPGFEIPGDFHPRTSVSVIIPARNEAANIAACIRSVLQQDYPPQLLEIIVVDDHSEDDTARIVQSLGDARVRCMRLADHLPDEGPVNAYKKKALATGISHSSGALIITTDADCTAPAQWLRSMAAIYEKEHPVMIIAPVAFTCDGSMIQLFQSLDFMSMQGMTAAAHRLRLGSMSNGANLAFTREAFYRVDEYSGAEHLASGDDYLLTVKMQARFPGRISYLKTPGAIIQTAPQPGWGSFLQQRIRWASKSGRYRDGRLTAILVLVYAFNLSFLVMTAAACADHSFLPVPMAMLFIKICVELYYLRSVADFFGARSRLRLFPFLQPLHIIYVVVAGLLGSAGVYRWKGRRVK